MKGEQLVMGKKKDILFEGLGGFDYEKQLSNFVQSSEKKREIASIS